MSSAVRLAQLIRCTRINSIGVVTSESNLHLYYQMHRRFSSQIITCRSTIKCSSSQSKQLFNRSIRNRLMASNVAWSSSSTASETIKSIEADASIGPLNLSKISDELAALANADKSGENVKVAEDYSIANIDLSEFTAPIADSAIPETLLTASDIGLTWWAPTNLVFKSLMALHEKMPWFGSIVVLTVCLRLILFPVMVRNMKASSNMQESVKALEKYRQEFRTAMESDNQALQVKSAINLLDKVKNNQLFVLKSLSPMMLMGVFFSSTFFAIRGMANYPIESMKTEGVSWFTDLTLPDPYYALPILTASTLYYVIKSGNETAPVDPMSAKILAIMPIVLCPVVAIAGCAFPAALNTYWLTNNLISLGQGMLIRKTALREILKIPDPVTVNEANKGSMQSTLEMQQEVKLAAEIVGKVYKAQMNKDITSRVKKLQKD